ncbi:MAG: hypothetical protein ACE5EO_09470 [Candidatus Krumholzibacteriia bacterium]
MASDRPKGYFTIRLAGFFFLLSAVIELASITSEAPLFGAMRGGLAAVAYHAVYIAAFGAMGLGLWRAETWGPSAIFAGTVLYSLDRAVYLLGDPTLGHGALLSVLEPELLRMAATTATLTAVACWWGFAGYIYARRGYFAG